MIKRILLFNERQLNLDYAQIIYCDDQKKHLAVKYPQSLIVAVNMAGTSRFQTQNTDMSGLVLNEVRKQKKERIKETTYFQYLFLHGQVVEVVINYAGCKDSSTAFA